MTSNTFIFEKTGISVEEFKARREKVLAFLAETGRKNSEKYHFVLESGRLKNFSNDVFYPFRVNSNFYYLTGFTEANAAMILDPNSDKPFKLFVEANDPEKIIWEGEKTGLEGADLYGPDQILDIEDFETHVEQLQSKERPVADFLASLRTIKSKAEIAIMQKAADITVQAHNLAKEFITPGIHEYEVEAALLNVFRQQGSSGWSYPPIVASGAKACILHYIENNKKIEKNDLVLIDAGCEYKYYAADITRTYAASGEMTSRQQDVYDLVLEAQEAAIKSVQPGNSFKETHEITQAVIANGLQELGYIKDKDNPEEVKKYFMHGTGHSLGIDVHDCGIDRKSSNYIPGMVTTIEPGIYIKEENIGIRIEDDVLVTNDGYDVLTANLLK